MVDFLHKTLYNELTLTEKGECHITLQPNNFALEPTTVWSFKDRGDWATHSGKYRGNWSPYVPRNLILRYSKPGDWILDQFMGSGTTLVEAKLLNRNAVGIDINPQSVLISETNLKFQCETKSKIFAKNGDATKLHCIKIRVLILFVLIHHMLILSSIVKEYLVTFHYFA